MDEMELQFLRASFAVAQRARDKGNHPFGALLVDEAGQLIEEAENTVVTTMDCTGHAETNLMRLASAKYDREYLAKCTLYTSTEPCAMCAGAIFWANVRRVVFGLSNKRLNKLVGAETEDVLHLSCNEIFKMGSKSIEVIGPLLEKEALVVHEGFWK